MVLSKDERRERTNASGESVPRCFNAYEQTDREWDDDTLVAGAQ